MANKTAEKLAEILGATEEKSCKSVLLVGSSGTGRKTCIKHALEYLLSCTDPGTLVCPYKVCVVQDIDQLEHYLQLMTFPTAEFLCRGTRKIIFSLGSGPSLCGGGAGAKPKRSRQLLLDLLKKCSAANASRWFMRFACVLYCEDKIQAPFDLIDKMKHCTVVYQNAPKWRQVWEFISRADAPAECRHPHIGRGTLEHFYEQSSNNLNHFHRMARMHADGARSSPSSGSASNVVFYQTAPSTINPYKCVQIMLHTDFDADAGSFQELPLQEQEQFCKGASFLLSGYLHSNLSALLARNFPEKNARGTLENLGRYGDIVDLLGDSDLIETGSCHHLASSTVLFQSVIPAMVLSRGSAIPGQKYLKLDKPQFYFVTPKRRSDVLGVSHALEERSGTTVRGDWQQMFGCATVIRQLALAAFESYMDVDSCASVARAALVDALQNIASTRTKGQLEELLGQVFSLSRPFDLGSSLRSLPFSNEFVLFHGFDKTATVASARASSKVVPVPKKRAKTPCRAVAIVDARGLVPTKAQRKAHVATLERLEKAVIKYCVRECAPISASHDLVNVVPAKRKPSIKDKKRLESIGDAFVSTGTAFDRAIVVCPTIGRPRPISTNGSRSSDVGTGTASAAVAVVGQKRARSSSSALGTNKGGPPAPPKTGPSSFAALLRSKKRRTLEP